MNKKRIYITIISILFLFACKTPHEKGNDSNVCNKGDFIEKVEELKSHDLFSFQLSDTNKYKKMRYCESISIAKYLFRDSINMERFATLGRNYFYKKEAEKQSTSVFSMIRVCPSNSYWIIRLHYLASGEILNYYSVERSLKIGGIQYYSYLIDEKEDTLFMSNSSIQEINGQQISDTVFRKILVNKYMLNLLLDEKEKSHSGGATNFPVFDFLNCD